jgi:hypothetical protein
MMGNNTLPAAFSVTHIPEPGSFILLGTGLLGIAGSVRRIWIQGAVTIYRS